MTSSKLVSKRDLIFNFKLNSGIAELRCICEPRLILILNLNRQQALLSSKLVSKRKFTFDFKLNSGIAELSCPCEPSLILVLI